MKKSLKLLLLNLAIPLAVGGLASLLAGGMAGFRELAKPPLSPPGWVFPVVWTVLYLLMGYGAYKVVISGKPDTQVRPALGVYGFQLFVNFLWPIIFFRCQAYGAAFIVLLILWALILANILKFNRIDEKAGDLLLPYILWVTFAGYLNLGVYVLS